MNDNYVQPLEKCTYAHLLTHIHTHSHIHQHIHSNSCTLMQVRKYAQKLMKTYNFQKYYLCGMVIFDIIQLQICIRQL